MAVMERRGLKYGARSIALIVAIGLTLAGCARGATSGVIDGQSASEPTAATETPTAETDSATGAEQASGSTAEGVEVAQWGDNVSITINGDGSFRFESDGLPNHELPDQFLVPNEGNMPPFDGDDIAAEFNIANTDELIVASPLDVTITMNPVYSEEVTQTSLSTIGVMISGAPLFNDYEDQTREFVALDDNIALDGVYFIDSCNGHPLASGDSYHYHGVPYCITDDVDVAGSHSTIIGVLLDGFPIYGPQDVDGTVLSNSDLDECSGHVGPTPEFPAGIYHYHLTEDANPYSIDCFHGEIEYGGGGPGGGGGGGRADGQERGQGPDLTDAAATLGVSVDDLSAALGRPPFDLDAAAATLGVDAAELEAVLPAPPGGGGGAPPAEDAGAATADTATEPIEAGSVAAVDIGLFFDGALVSDAVTEPCTLSGGVESTCYRITAAGNPVSYETGPFCPSTIDDTAEAGGLWFDGTGVYDVDGAFIAGLDELYGDDNWRMYDDDGNVMVIESAEEFDLAARPNVDPSLQNHCVEGRLEWLPNGEPISSTVLLPVEPVLADTPVTSRGNLGVTLDGVVIAQSAPVDAILGAYTIAAFDDCGGHYNPNDGYHLHGAVGCSEVGEVSGDETPMFAYAMDGIPVHSPLDDPSQAGLDACNGHETAEHGYHYHANNAAENQVLTCLVGQTATSAGAEGAAERGARPEGERPDGERPDGERTDGERTDGERPDGERPDGPPPGAAEE